jgi:uncharacterized membrane protein (DUF2068 family)
MAAKHRLGLRSIALVEGIKALVALMAATGVALHERLRPFINALAAHLHLNPANDHPLAIVRALRTEASAHLRLLALGALLYAVMRLLEAAGLWRGKAWALWLGAVSAMIYLPFEFVELLEHPGVLTVTLLGVNGAVALYLTRRVVALRRRASPASGQAQREENRVPTRAGRGR